MTTPITIAAAGADDSASNVLAIFVGIAVVGTVATFATTRLYARLQRHRWVAALTAGGWFATMAGLLVGPRGLGVVDQDGLGPLRPLLEIALVWIGLIVGLQLRRTLIHAIPSLLRRWIAVDLAIAIPVGVVFTVAVGYALLADWQRVLAIGPGFALVIAFLSWAPETRSLRPQLSPRTGDLSQLIQAGGGIGAVISIVAFSLVSRMFHVSDDAVSIESPTRGALDLVLTLGIALLLGFGARLLLRRTSGVPQEVLVITLAIVLLATGFAHRLQVNPVLVGLLLGGIFANLRDPHLRDLERGLQSAEPGMAVLLLLGCGTIASGGNLGKALAIGTAIAVVRLIVKPMIARRMLGPTFPDLSRRDPLFLGPARVPMIAIAIAAAPVLETSTHAGATVLGSVIVAMLLGALTPAVSGLRPSSSETTPKDGSEATT